MITTALVTELDAVDAGHPRFVSPLGDRRERRVPCRECGTQTLAWRPTICVRCQPISDDLPAGSSDGGDVHPSHQECDVTATSANNRNAPVAADTAPGQ